MNTKYCIKKFLLSIVTLCLFFNCQSGQLKIPQEKTIAKNISSFDEIIRVDFGISKVYLIPLEESGWFMLDTGFSEDFEKFKEALEELDINIAEIKYLLLTHAHDDHVGFAQTLQEESDCTLIYHENGIPYLAEGKMLLEESQTATRIISVLSRAFASFKNRSFTFNPIELGKDDIVCIGEEELNLEKIGLKGKIIKTPGHTRDSITLILDDGSVFCGDTAMNYLRFFGADYRPIFFYDIDLIMGSWQKMIDLGGAVIYPNHGDPFAIEILAERIDKYSTH